MYKRVCKFAIFVFIFVSCNQIKLIKEIELNNRKGIFDILSKDIDVSSKTLVKAVDVSCDIDIWSALCESSTKLDENIDKDLDLPTYIVSSGRKDYIFALASQGAYLSQNVFENFMNTSEELLMLVRLKGHIPILSFGDATKKGYAESVYIELIPFIGVDINESVNKYSEQHVFRRLMEMGYNTAAMEILKRREVMELENGGVWDITFGYWDRQTLTNPYWDYLLQKDYDIQTNGIQLLSRAVYVLDLLSAKFLLNNGVDVNGKIKNSSPYEELFNEDTFYWLGLIGKNLDGSRTDQELEEAEKLSCKYEIILNDMKEVFINKDHNPDLMFEFNVNNHIFN